MPDEGLAANEHAVLFPLTANGNAPERENPLDHFNELTPPVCNQICLP